MIFWIELREIGGKMRMQNFVYLYDPTGQSDLLSYLIAHLPANKFYYFYEDEGATRPIAFDDLMFHPLANSFSDPANSLSDPANTQFDLQAEAQLPPQPMVIYVKKVPLAKPTFYPWSGLQLANVSGPISYSKIVLPRETGNPLVIHSFGDYHDRVSGCFGDDAITITQLLKNTLWPMISSPQDTNIYPKSRVSFIDFFVEDDLGKNRAFPEETSPHSASPRLFTERNSLRDKLKKLLENCVPYFRRHLEDLGLSNVPGLRCPYDKVRVHYTDPRHFVLENQPAFPNPRIFKHNVVHRVENQIRNIRDQRERLVALRVLEDCKKMESHGIVPSSYSSSEIKTGTKPHIFDTYNLARLLRSYDGSPVERAIVISGNLHKRWLDNLLRGMGAQVFSTGPFPFVSPDPYNETDLDPLPHAGSQCIQIPLANEYGMLTLDWSTDLYPGPTAAPPYVTYNLPAVGFLTYNVTASHVPSFSKNKPTLASLSDLYRDEILMNTGHAGL